MEEVEVVEVVEEAAYPVGKPPPMPSGACASSLLSSCTARPS